MVVSPRKRPGSQLFLSDFAAVGSSDTPFSIFHFRKKRWLNTIGTVSQSLNAWRRFQSGHTKTCKGAVSTRSSRFLVSHVVGLDWGTAIPVEAGESCCGQFTDYMGVQLDAKSQRYGRQDAVGKRCWEKGSRLGVAGSLASAAMVEDVQNCGLHFCTYMEASLRIRYVHSALKTL